MADNYIDVTLSEIFGTGVASVEQTETSAEPGGYNVWTITLTNGHTSTFTVRNGTAGGSPMPVLNSVDMTDTTGIYLYLGNEEGFVTGHWYCYANDAWTDFGAYSEKGDPGLAPTVEVSKTGGTTTITITDAEGEHVATIEDGISPTVKVANTAADMTDTSLIYVYAGSETAYNNGDWYIYDSYIGQWRSGGTYQASVPRIDQTLTVQGAAADAKKTGDEISELKSQIAQSAGLTSEIKQALMDLANNVAWSGDDPTGQTYINALHNALYPPIVVTNITLNTSSLSFATLNSTQQLTATTTPTGGEVTWSSSNTSVATVSATGLVTAVAWGNATITATSGNVSATCSVSIAQATVTSISAVYAQGSKVIYDTDSLDSLKDDLTVTASWSNGTTSTVASADYTLSGTLVEGTSTITVSYGGQTATFDVVVTHDIGFDFEAVQGNFSAGNTDANRVTLKLKDFHLEMNHGNEIVITLPSAYNIFGYTLAYAESVSYAAGNKIYSPVYNDSGTLMADVSKITVPAHSFHSTDSDNKIYCTFSSTGATVKEYGILVKKTDDSNFTPSDLLSDLSIDLQEV